MRPDVRFCARTRALMAELDAAHRRGDVISAQQALNSLYAQFDAAAAMANTLDGVTA